MIHKFGFVDHMTCAATTPTYRAVQPTGPAAPASRVLQPCSATEATATCYSWVYAAPSLSGVSIGVGCDSTRCSPGWDTWRLQHAHHRVGCQYCIMRTQTVPLNY